MPTATIDNTLQMHYELDDFTDPWLEPETVVIHHGIAKSARLWYMWPPLLARKYRVVRLDARGFGLSSVPPPGYPWSLSGFAGDLRGLLDHLKVEKVHLIGDTLGGIISLQFAYEYPSRLKSLTLTGTPFNMTAGKDRYAAWAQQVAEHGVPAWATDNTDRRFGERPEHRALAEWYSNEMGKTSRRVMLELFSVLPSIDLTAILPKIHVPTLILAGESSGVLSVRKVRQMNELMPGSKLVTFPNAPNQIHAALAEECAQEFLKFVAGLKGK